MRARFAYIVCTVVALLLFVMPTLAQDEVAGRVVTKQDWINFMPVFIGSIIVVIIVDAFFILPIFRKSKEEKSA